MSNETRSGRLVSKIGFIIFILSSVLAVTGCRSSRTNAATERTEPAKGSSSAPSNFQKRQQEAEEQLRPEIERQRQQDQKEAEKTLDQDAINSIQQTEGAIQCIAENRKDDALAEIERATGKINILLARNPASAVIPVDVQVVIIDAAPTDLKQIDHIVQLATDATKDKDLPAARILLASVISELRIRTTSLPLATYPEALKRAAQLLDQGKNRDAGNVLLTALNTLVIVDHVLPLPLVLAQAAIDQANSQRQNNKVLALTLLEAAKNEIMRSRHLGYLSEDAEYKALDDEIANLESAVKGTGNTTSLFAQLRERIAAFINRQKEHANQ
jgi:hypothetical protein